MRKCSLATLKAIYRISSIQQSAGYCTLSVSVFIMAKSELAGIISKRLYLWQTIQISEEAVHKIGL